MTALVPDHRQTVLANIVEALACAGVVFLVHIAACRITGVPVPRVVLPALGSILVAIHLSVGFSLAQRPDLKIGLLVVLPSFLGLLPWIDRRLGVLGLASSLVSIAIATFLLGRARLALDPVPAAALGAALGFPIAFRSLRSYAWRVQVVNIEAEPWSLACVAGLCVGLVYLGRTRFPPLSRPAVRTAIGAAAFAAGALLAGPGSRPRPRPGAVLRSDPPPAVLIVLDTVRADHLRSYGYQRDTMPRLEQFARTHMTRVERSVASSSSSLPTHGSLFTGLLPSFHGGHGPAIEEGRSNTYHRLRDDWPTLSQLLTRAGYWTVAVAGNHVHLAPALGLGRGFAWYDARESDLWRFGAANPYRGSLADFPLSRLDRWAPFSNAEYFEESGRSRRATEIVDQGLIAIQEAKDRSFFLFLNLFDAHSPYKPAARARDLYPGVRLSYRGRQPTAPEMLRRLETRRDLEGKELEIIIDRYDSQLRFADVELDRLLGVLARHPRFQEMLIVVTSDHGEAFGEHGVFQHGRSVHDEVVRVPLFVKAGRRRPEGFAPGTVTPGPIQSVDLYATFLDHAGLTPPPCIDGVAWGRGRERCFVEQFPDPGQKPLWGPPPWRELRVSEAGGWKEIVSTSGSRELYDLATEPGERHDQSSRRSDLLVSLEEALRVTLGGRPVSRPSRRAQELPPDLVRSLRALGYLN